MSEEGLFLVGHHVSFIPQIINHMSLMRMEAAAGHETDMVAIHSRTPSVARKETDGHVVSQNGKALCPQGTEQGAEIGTRP